tara:strand:+ start:18932 stop:20146 length:1215 start_codon:yes stop_codon:yes gene_type:complete
VNSSIKNFANFVERPKSIYILSVTQTLVWAGLYYIFPALFAKWELSLNFTKTELTSAFTTAIIISSIMAPVIGRQIDNDHGQKILIFFTTFGAICLFCLSYVNSITMFYIIWCMIGISLSGSLYEPCFAYVTKKRGKESKNAIILITLVAGFAGTISFPVANILAEIFDWRFSLRFFSLLIILFVVPFIYIATSLEEKSDSISDKKQKKVKKYNIKNDLIQFKFVFLFISFLTLTLSHGSVVTHIIPLLLERKLFDGLEVLFSSLIGPMQVFGRLAMIALQERKLSINSISILIFLFKAFAVGCLLFAGNNIFLIALFIMFMGAGAGMTSISRAVVVADLMGYERFASISGIIAVGAIGGSAIAPIFGAQLWEYGGYDLMLKIVLIILFIGLINYLTALKLSKK